MDWTFKIISQRKQGRDFYLASNIEMWVNNFSYSFRPRLTTIDQVLSGGLYVLLAILPILLLGLQNVIK